MEESLLVLGNPRHASLENKNTFRILDSLLGSQATLRYFGATALDLAYVAAGRLDGCWYYSIQPWDVAAGLIIVQEAGGFAICFDSKPANAYSPTLLACNKALAPELQSLLAKAI
jgi:myo-inositol-1(or 4)-monophosphatase